MPVSVSVPTLLVEPVAVTLEPGRPVADKVPALVEMTTVRSAEPFPRALDASKIWPLLIDTAIADGRFKVGWFTADALAVVPETVILLPAEPLSTMPVVAPLSVTPTEPVPLALSLPALK